jgi:hypothetical protein
MGTRTDIHSFTVNFRDGTSVLVLADGGEGFYREENFVGQKSSFVTRTVFVANGKSRELPGFK